MIEWKAAKLEIVVVQPAGSLNPDLVGAGRYWWVRRANETKERKGVQRRRRPSSRGRVQQSHRAALQNFFAPRFHAGR